MRSTVCALGALLLTPTLLWAQAPGPKPAAPPPDVPKLTTAKKPMVVCGDCDKPFDGPTHQRVLDGLLNNPYNEQLRRALFLQDSYHQFESKAHFDNCDFDGASAYITQLLAEVESHAQKASQAKSRADQPGVEAAVKDAFFALGQALHGVQDFYAHSNYVELATKDAKAWDDVKPLPLWTERGRQAIKALRSKGLVSGFVFWGFPQTCPSGTLSHAQLAKDTPKTKSGGVKVSHLDNFTQYQIAVQLAQASSQNFIDYAFKRWPLLKEVNGQSVAFELLVDRRGL